MNALDTNIVVRIILEDVDDPQTTRARAYLDRPAFVPISVLMEAGWVLSGAYAMGRAQLAEALLGLVCHPLITVPDFANVVWALERHRDAPSDLADLLHIAASDAADRFATFDRRLPKQAGANTPVKVEAVG